MPPRVKPPKVAVMAGGRRVKKGKRMGPSAEQLKKYRQDDKERLKRQAKLAKGGLRNDTSAELIAKLKQGILVVLSFSAVTFVLVRVATVSPQEAAEIMVAVSSAFIKQYGSLIAWVAAIAGAAWFGLNAIRARNLAAAAAAVAAAERDKAAEAKERRRKERKTATAQQRAMLKARVAEQQAAIAGELAEMERVRSEQLESEAVLKAEAAAWLEAEQVELDAAIDAEPPKAGLSPQERWKLIAERVPNRTVQQCLYRVQYCREQAAKEAALVRIESANSTYDGSDLPDPEPTKSDYRRWITAHYSDDSDLESDSDASVEIGSGSGGDGEPCELELEPTARGTALTLGKTMWWNISTVRIESARLLLTCNRCGTPRSATLSGMWRKEALSRERCIKCTQIVSASLRPCLLHEETDTIGHVDLVDCTVTDVLGLTVQATCEGCGDPYAMKEMQRNQRVEHGCAHCQSKLAFQAGSFDAVQLTAAGSGSRVVSRAPSRDKAASKHQTGKRKLPQKIVEGQPLPNNGACDHFKKSYRWLRFKCCGRAFPCPVCHELDGCDGAIDGIRAGKMICGKCSREQNFANASCVSCGFDMGLGKSAGRAFWHGGTKNQALLSKKDGRKHKGVSKTGAAKTTSKKAERVGKAGASKHREKSGGK